MKLYFKHSCLCLQTNNGVWAIPLTIKAYRTLKAYKYDKARGYSYLTEDDCTEDEYEDDEDYWEDDEELDSNDKDLYDDWEGDYEKEND